MSGCTIMCGSYAEKGMRLRKGLRALAGVMDSWAKLCLPEGADPRYDDAEKIDGAAWERVLAPLCGLSGNTSLVARAEKLIVTVSAPEAHRLAGR